MSTMLPKVLVYSITYNHSKFITKALNGFSSQHTDFPYLCCVIDDCSIDNEQDLIRSYIYENCHLDSITVTDAPYAEIITAQHKANDNCRFAIYLLKYNHYSRGLSQKKYEYLDEEWRNNIKYTAYCEGDDYWEDENKLQKQVVALDNHPDLDMCVHSYIEKNALSGEVLNIKSLGDNERIISLEEMIMGEGGKVGTNTIMVRTILNNHFPPFRKMMNYDYSLQIHGALRGGVLYLPDTMSVYNVGVPDSFCSRAETDEHFRNDFLKKKINMMEQLDKDLDYQYHKYIQARLLLSTVSVFNSINQNVMYFFRYRKGYWTITIKERIKIFFEKTY